MRVLGLVPARGGSRRVPRKNLADLGGRTLVRRALDASLGAGCFSVVALSSDDPEILAEADGLPVIPLSRPDDLAQDDTLVIDAVSHALDMLEPEHGRFDAFAIVQCTSPFTEPADLAGAISMLEQTGAGSVVSVASVPATRHPWKLKRMEGDRLLPFLEDDRLLPSQELPALWQRNGSVYASRREVLDEGRLLATDVRGYVMPAERSLDIDTPLDLAFARFLLESMAP